MDTRSYIIRHGMTQSSVRQWLLYRRGIGFVLSNDSRRATRCAITFVSDAAQMKIDGTLVDISNKIPNGSFIASQYTCTECSLGHVSACETR